MALTKGFEEGDLVVLTVYMRNGNGLECVPQPLTVELASISAGFGGMHTVRMPLQHVDAMASFNVADISYITIRAA